MANLVEILVVGKNMAKPMFEEVRSESGSLKTALAGVGMAAAAGLGAIAVEAVKMSAQYQSSTTRLVTSAGESTQAIGMVRSGMLDMAGQVGVSANDLSKAMYFVEAAGYHAGDGLTVLKAAAQGAAAEGADTTDVAKALTDVLVDYHMKASSAADVTSKMIQAVAHGKVNLEDFSKSFASIVPLAAQTGISFNDVGAALAEMTNHGMTAQRASQNLAQALRSLLNPTTPMKKAFQEFGVSADELRAKLHGPNGLTDAMQYLDQAALKAGKQGTPEFTAALKQMIGTAPGLLAALNTVGENFSSTTDTITAMAKATADSKGQVQGFALVQQTLGQQWKDITAAWDSMLIRLGDGLTPVLTRILGQANGFAGQMQKTLGSAFSGIASGFSGHAGQVPAMHLTGRAARMQEGAGADLPAPKLTGWQQLGQVLRGVADDLRKFGEDAGKAFVELAKAAGPTLQLLGGAALVALQAVASILANVVGPALVQVSKFMDQHKAAVRDLITVALIPLAIRLAALSVIKPVVAIAGLAKDVAMFPISQSKAIFDGVQAGIGNVKKAAAGAQAVWGGIRFGAVTAWQMVGEGAIKAQLAVSDFAGKASKLVQDGLLKAAGGAGTAWGTIVRGAQSARDAIADFGGKAGAAVAKLGSSAWSGMVEGLSGLAGSAKQAAIAMGEMAMQGLRAAVAGLRAAAAWAAEKIELLAQTAAEKGAAAAQWLLDAAMDASPIGLIVLAIAGLIAAFVALWTHSAAFRDFWKGLWKDITAIISAVVDWIKTHWPLLLAILTGPIGMAVLIIVKNWRAISDGAAAVWYAVVGAFTSMANWLLRLPAMIFHAASGLFDFIGREAWNITNQVFGFFNQIISFAASIPSKVMGSLGSLGSSALHALGFAHGGVVGAAAVGGPRGGMVMVGEQGPELVSLPFGSTVHSNPDTQRMLAGAAGGGGPSVELHISTGGAPMDELLAQLIKKYVFIRGGNVQSALGVPGR